MTFLVFICVCIRLPRFERTLLQRLIEAIGVTARREDKIAQGFPFCDFLERLSTWVRRARKEDIATPAWNASLSFPIEPPPPPLGSTLTSKASRLWNHGTGHIRQNCMLVYLDPSIQVAPW
jgi:hypothetical protein